MVRRHPVALSLLLLSALGVATTGCSTRFLQRTVERRLRNRLTSLIGPADRYTVSISGTDDSDLVLGRVRRLQVSGVGVLIGGELPIERFEMRLEHLRYTGASPDLISVRESELQVDLLQSALNDYLAEGRKEKDVQARFVDGRLVLSMTLKLFGVPTRLVATGRLELEGDKRIVFRADTVEAPNAPLLGVGKTLVERQFNPLVDMDALHVPVRLKALSVVDGRILLRGEADLAPKSRPYSHK
jgi:LmeA-like phospholipid-binding